MISDGDPGGHSPITDNPFWRWSLGAYSRDGVAPRLLHLQDEFIFDVNMVLWCCWLAGKTRPVANHHLNAAIDRISRMNEETVAPLRARRRQLKDRGDEDAYMLAKQAELAAEKQIQALLFEIAEPMIAASKSADPDDQRFDALSNLEAYARLLDATNRSGFSPALLRELIDHIFPAGDA